MTVVVDITQHEQGAILPVKAQPGSRRSEIRGEQDGMLKVCVTQVAEKGKANKAIIALVAKLLKLKKSQIELVSGDTASRKQLLIRDIGADSLKQLVRPFVEAE